MADITLVCSSCKATLTLSEYAKPANLICPSCQAPMIMPEPTRNNTAEQLLPDYIRKAKAEAEAARKERGDEPDISLVGVTSSIHGRRRKRRVSTDLLFPALKAFFLFLVLGAACAYLRYFKGYTLFLPENELDMLRISGALAIFFFHVVITIEAFSLDFLTGIFCLLIPGYSLYYLFTESDSFWLRAVVAALLVGFGVDFAEYVRDYAVQTYNFINAWLAAGAEMNKPILK